MNDFLKSINPRRRDNETARITVSVIAIGIQAVVILLLIASLFF